MAFQVFSPSFLVCCGLLLLALNHSSMAYPGFNGSSTRGSDFQCKCGQVNRSGRRIVGGQATEKNEYPWQIGLYKDNGNSFHCGGSIISKREILTAAHCVINHRTGRRAEASELVVKVGDWNRRKPDGETSFKVKGYSAHQKFYVPGRGASLPYDFAVVTLEEDIEFSEEVSPVCLPESSGLQPGLNEGVEVYITGWGGLSKGEYPTLLQEIKITTFKCGRMICGKNDHKSTCSGDSGGAWVTQVGNSYVQIGVHSGGHCAKGELFASARVTTQLDWIKRQILSDGCPRA